MARKLKIQVGVVLLTIAAVLAVAGMVNWQSADDTASSNRMQAGFDEAFGVAAPKTDADHTASYVLFGLGALGVVCAAVMLATAPPLDPSDERTEPATQDSGWG